MSCARGARDPVDGLFGLLADHATHSAIVSAVTDLAALVAHTHLFGGSIANSQFIVNPVRPDPFSHLDAPARRRAQQLV
jgi:hypothetical protein